MMGRRSPRTTSSRRWSAWSPPGNSGLKGVIAKGSAVATDANTVTFTLASANGNFPYLVSVFNAQSLITPKAYVAGTTLDKQPAGTGAWKLTKLRPSQSGVKFARNDDWWGGKTPLDGTEFTFFDDTGPMVTAYQGGQIDAIVQFDVLSGAPLFTDPNFTVVDTPTTNHREIWMRCDTGQFVDKRVRQALALTIDRPALIQQLFKGKAIPANDHVIWNFYPYFSDTVTQRTQDIAKAKQLLSDAGKTDLKATLQYGKLNEIADLAVLLQSQAAQAGITITPAGGDNNPFYDLQWCPPKPADPPCSGAAEFGIVDYGHRASPGRVPELGVQDEGRLELVAILVARLRCGLQGIPERGRRRRAEGRLRQDREDHERGCPGRHPVLVQLPLRQLEEVHGRLHVRARTDVPLGSLHRLAPMRGERPAVRAFPFAPRARTVT